MNSAKLKICHLTETFLPKVGGAQIVIDTLAAEQARCGHRVWVACPSYGALKGPHPRDGYVVVRCFGANPLTFGLRLGSWLRLAARERFDIIHAHNAWPSGAIGAITKRFGAKLVVTSHGRDLLVEPSIGYGSRLNPLARLAIRRALGAADRHTVVSEGMVESAVKAGSAQRNVVIVPNFLPADAQSVMNSGGSAGDYLLVLGRLHQVKGVDLAIKAFAGIASLRPALKLLVAGEGQERSALVEQIDRLGLEGRVIMLGRVTGADKAAIISGALALLVTSRVEAFCLAALEAMALGVPVMAPERPPFTDIVNSENGFFIDPKTPSTILDALERLEVPGERDSLAAAARATAAVYTARAAAELYNEVYRSVIAP